VRRDQTWLVAPERPSPRAIEVPVVKVCDGDGFLTHLESSDTPGESADDPKTRVAVRFGFIDAPEIGQPGGAEAREFLRSLISGKTVWIDILEKMDTGRSTDAYGRLVVVPFLEQEYSACVFEASPANRGHLAHRLDRPLVLTRNIELEMVLNGWAWVMERYGPDDRYLDALEDARRSKRGIWSRDDNVSPWRFKQKNRSICRQTGQLDISQRAANGGCAVKGCGGTLVVRSGRFGAFLGCSNYPTCRFSRSIEPA
jgi:micrococcal nuclease